MIYKWWFPFWFTNIKNNNNKKSLLKVIIILCIWQENVQMCHPLFDDDDDYYHNDYMNDKNCYDNHSGVANTIDTCSIWFYFDLPIFFPVSGCCWFIFFFPSICLISFQCHTSVNQSINWSIDQSLLHIHSCMNEHFQSDHSDDVEFVWLLALHK
mgnify:CR=1 FL=1